MKDLLELLKRMREARAAWLDSAETQNDSVRLEREYMDAMCEFAALTAAMLDNGLLTDATAPAAIRPFIREHVRLAGAGR